MSIEFLSEHLKALELNAQSTLSAAQENPDDFLLQVAAKNQQQAVIKAKHDLLLEQAKLSSELLDLRLIGPKANGSISLDVFNSITVPLSKAWHLAASRLRNGSITNKPSSDIHNALNLKLAGIASGSTHILLTGNGIPDLTGSNLLHETLLQTFRLLNANNEDFYDAVDAIGGKAATYFGAAMKAIDSAGLGAEFRWHTSSKEYFWAGRPDEILRIKVLLDSVNEPETYDEIIKGTVAGIADTGRLVLRSENREKIYIRFPLKLTAQVQKLTIAKEASLNVRTSKYWDAVTKEDIYKRLMISLKE